jgi:hypothetical protein
MINLISLTGYGKRKGLSNSTKKARSKLTTALITRRRELMEKNNWKFKEGAEPQGSSNGFWYDITTGGYIKPSSALEEQGQINKIEELFDMLKLIWE